MYLIRWIPSPFISWSLHPVKHMYVSLCVWKRYWPIALQAHWSSLVTILAAKLVFYTHRPRQTHTKTFSVTLRIVRFCISELVDDYPDKVLSLCCSSCREADACVCVFPASCCLFLRFCASLFSLGILLNLLFMYEAGMFICEQAVKHLKNFIPIETRIELMSEGDVTDCVRLCASASTHHQSLPLQNRNFRYFLLNAVTYGPVLYLLSAMQLSL